MASPLSKRRLSAPRTDILGLRQDLGSPTFNLCGAVRACFVNVAPAMAYGRQGDVIARAPIGGKDRDDDE
jgi:hypothetical protein